MRVQARLIGLEPFRDAAEGHQQQGPGHGHHGLLVGAFGPGQGGVHILQRAQGVPERLARVGAVVARLGEAGVVPQRLLEEGQGGTHVALIAQHRAQGVPQHRRVRLDPEQRPEGLDGVAVALLVALHAGEVVGRLDVAGVGGEIFEQQLLGDIEVANLLRQPTQIVGDVGFVGQELERRLIGHQGLSQIARLFPADRQHMPAQAVGLVELERIEGATGPEAEIAGPNGHQGGLQLFERLALGLHRQLRTGELARQFADRLGRRRIAGNALGGRGHRVDEFGSQFDSGHSAILR